MLWILVLALTAFAVLALVVWWMLDFDMPDVVASSATPIIGVCLIYWYGTLLAWAAGLVLLAIGAFSLYVLIRRRKRPPPDSA
jgi:hypothetical protein